ncbi:MAG TPA: monomethylamine:corrinoid methyltransferase [Chloroflexi bacterium]|nr:monomethylamine:corrinoid methyltransferase [Chloroflexota bacterium]
MQDFFEIFDRAVSGNYISEEDWDIQKVAATARRLVKKYHLEWDPRQIVVDDSQLVDAVYQAGFEMAVELGVYCRSTERIINFSQDEIEAALNKTPQTLVMGEGKDQRTLYARHMDEERPPLFFGGSPGSPIPERYFLENVISYVQEPSIDLATCGTLTAVNGRIVRTGHPLEVVATRRELLLMHKALERVNRPGMGMLGAQSSVSELGDLSVASPTYLRTCDSHLVPMLNELKVDFRNLARVVNSLGYGMINASLPCVIMGGLGGAPPGSAVVNVASFLLANLVCQADYHILHPIHIRQVATSAPEVLWVISVVGQAFARNAPSIIVADIYPKSGAGTIELLYETAANAIVNTMTGSHLEGCGSADGKLPNCSGLEARWMAEVALASHQMKMSLRQANDWVLKLLPLYEKVFSSPEGNPGSPFDQVYDLDTLKPMDSWQKIYETVKEQLRLEGMNL